MESFRSLNFLVQNDQFKCKIVHTVKETQFSLFFLVYAGINYPDPEGPWGPFFLKL